MHPTMAKSNKNKAAQAPAKDQLKRTAATPATKAGKAAAKAAGAKAGANASPAPVKSKQKATSEMDDIFSGKSAASKPAAAEIDDIFGGKTVALASSNSSANPTDKKKKIKKKAAAKATEDPAAKADAEPAKPVTKLVSKVVEVVDASTAKGEVAPANFAAAAPSEAKSKKRMVESKDEFLGNSGKKRFTDDGHPIYYLEDLIAQEGGDTELCPFDCECCF
ncbi:hypothetical protein AMAG_09216 [Allomyces macrogynus ATCC 38327]|uniref:DUF1764 domain-containing protein n=1 Tax=Allomyces macrogynus (strain ATCC 38327) TaxID=578462 RepID=A0A0L0SP77_ALLM3|nr:hypothetical protein AMAG_09216 [Allomyces macrogynus ATCC 38327]|eukprot:KNE64175.1 hypothetical protein AMAG_09216 [Allomyces macrogynus ATCC 38327]